MIDLLTFCLITAFKITAIHIMTWPGKIFFTARNKIGKFLYEADLRYLEKPLYDCLPCMASVWGIFFWIINGCEYGIFEYLLTLCGMLAIIEYFVNEGNEGVSE